MIDAFILRPVRTDYGKAIRKKYESREIKISRHSMTRLEPRLDGIANTLTTVLKDNYVMIIEFEEVSECQKIQDIDYTDKPTR